MKIKGSFLRVLESFWGMVIIALAAFVLLALDYYTGREVRLVYLLILPVSVASLARHRPFAYGLAAALPLIRLTFFLPWGESSSLGIGLMNAGIRTFVLMYIAFFMGQVRLMYEYRNRVQQQELNDRIQKLEGVLPMCANCKRVRDAQGNYQYVEVFLEERAKTIVSHGLCPECRDRLYSDVKGANPGGA